MASRRKGEQVVDGVERVRQPAERLEADEAFSEDPSHAADEEAFHIDPALVEAAQQSELMLRSAFSGARVASRAAGRALSGTMSTAGGLLAPPERDPFADPPARMARLRAQLSDALREGAALVEPRADGEEAALVLERLVRTRPGATLTAAAGLGLAAGLAIRKALLRVPFPTPRRRS